MLSGRVADAALVAGVVVLVGAVTAALWLPARARVEAEPAALSPVPVP